MSSNDHTGRSGGPPPLTPGLLREAGLVGRDRTPEEVMSRIDAVLFGDEADEVSVDEELVTQSLDEILLALIELRDDGTHGTGLMEDMGRLFDVRPSPGTVYPRLHDLDDAGVLARHDLVQTKQYAVDDEAAATARIEAAMYGHLALGLFLNAALPSR